MPSMMKLNLDGSYLGHMEQLYKNLRNVSRITRSQLLVNNDNMEIEEYREKVESLKQIAESYRMIALGEEPGLDSDDEDEYNDVNDDY